MALLDRLKGEEDPNISPHEFWGALYAFADGQTTRAEIESIFGLSTTGPDATQLDTLVNGYTAAVDKQRYLNAVHGVFVLIENDDYITPTNAQIVAWLDAAGATYGIFRLRAYGGLFVDAPVSAQSIPNNVATKLAALTGASAMATDGGVISDSGAGEVVLPIAGDWQVAWAASFSGSANTSFRFSVFGNGTEVPGTRSTRELGSGAAAGIASISGGPVIANASVPGVAIDLRCFQSESGARDLTIETVQLSVSIA